MPPRWPRKPDPANDPALRKLGDRLNFAVHVAGFAAVNSALWFFHILRPDSLTYVPVVTALTLSVLLAHGIYVFAIADYSAKES